MELKAGSLRMRNRVFVCLTLFLLAKGPEAVLGEDWLGWRGLQKQGWSQGNGHPTNWSQNESVVWRTAIPGAGHSSPVVVGNQVFVTTVYESQKAAVWQNVTVLLKYLLALAATLMAVPFLFSRVCLKDNSRSSWRSFFSMWVLLLLWGTILLLCFFGEGLFDYARCPTRAWLASSCLLSMCFGLSFWVFSRGSAGRIGTGLFAIVFAVFVIFGIPAKEHALRGGFFSANSSVVLLAGGLPFVLGLLLVSDGFCRKKEQRAPGWRRCLVAGSIVDRLLLVGVALPLAIVLANFVAKALSVDPSDGASRIESGDMLFTWRMVALCGLGTGGGCLAAWILRRSRLAPLILLVSLVTLGLFFSLKMFEVVVHSFPYLTYHWGTPRWEPPLGWTAVWLFSGVTLAGSAFRFLRLTHTPPRPYPNEFKGLGVGIALLAIITFVDINYLRTESQFIRAILCLDRENGRIRWTCEALAGPLGTLDSRNSPATPTPVVDGNGVFAYFGTAGLMRCDFQGTLLWTCRSLPYANAYGAASSPVIAEGVLVLVCDMRRGDSRVWGIDAGSGQIIWSLPLEEGGSLSGNNRTPQIKHFDGRTVVIVWRAKELLAVDIRSGNICWRCPVKTSGDVVTSSVSDEDTLYLTHQAGTQAVSIKRGAAGLDPIRWRNTKPGSNCSSPVLVHGLLFLVGEYGEAVCLEAETGQTLWRERLPGQYRASVLADDRHVYFSNTKGMTTVVACDRLFRKVATNELGEPLSASFAVADGDFYVRTERNLFRIGNATVGTLHARRQALR